MGVKAAPQKICAAVAAKRMAATMPVERVHKANSLGTLVSSSAADHSAVPAANAGTLASRLDAVPESMTPSPMAKTRNPVAIASFPLRK
jgi:hypothetical protein